MENYAPCPVCGKTEIYCQRKASESRTFYVCPICGRFELFDSNDLKKVSGNKLSSYLYYHHFLEDNPEEYRYHTPLDKEICDNHRENFNNGNNTNGCPVHINSDLVESWYPKTFAEKIDFILLHLSEEILHIGQYKTFNMQELFGMLFIDYKEKTVQGWENRKISDCKDEATYMLDCLKKSTYIEFIDDANENDYIDIRLTPKGYERGDELQRYTNSGRNVLVAMKFGNDTLQLREAIRQGIADADYHAIFIDEVHHNDLITPELLKHIRDSKFVVVDLTHQNNGAYFEEGYAMGIGKPVIQLCKEDTKLHFDIAQKNTIIWVSEDSIPLMLKNRIKATIN